MNSCSGHAWWRTYLLLLLSFATFFSGPGPAHADWRWDLSLGTGVEYNDNVDLLADESVLEADIRGRVADEERRREALEALREVSRDDTIYTVTPSVGAEWSEGDDSIGIDYRVQYRDYSESLRKDEWIHRLKGGLDWQRMKPFRLTVRDTLDVTPRDLVTPEEDLRTQIQHNALTVRPSLFWDVSPTTSLEAAYIYERDDYYGDDLFDDSEDDALRHLGELKASRKWSPRWESWLRLTGGVAEHEIAEDYDLLEGAVGGLHLLSRRTEFSWEAMLQNRWYELSDDKLELLVDGLLSWQHHEKGRFDLSYSRDVDDRFDGESILKNRGEAAEIWAFPGGSAITVGAYYEHRDYRIADRTDEVWEPYAELSYAVTNWLAFAVEGGYRVSQVESTTLVSAAAGADEKIFLTEKTDEELARARLAVVLTPWRPLALEVAYEHLNNISGEPLDEYSRNAVSLVITGSLSGLSR